MWIADVSGNVFDDLVYNPESTKPFGEFNNRLHYVQETANSVNGLSDFKEQLSLGDPMFLYDGKGRLVQDRHEGFGIYYDPNDKITRIDKDDPQAYDLSFIYDGNGNRIGINLWKLDELEEGSFYVRDFDGNGNSMDSKSSFIFGFGNDQSHSYQYLKGLEVPQLRKGMKSLQYNFSESYKKLRLFTTPNSAKKEYEVHVIGHSCGNTDQTILKPLFTSDNCKAIYLYNHDGVDGQREKLLNLDLFFNSQEELNEKVMPYNEDLRIPQLKTP